MKNVAAGASNGSLTRRVMAWAAVFAVTWGLLEIAVGAILHSRYHIMQIVWCRYAAHLAVVMLVWGRRRPALWRTRRPLTQVLRSLMMLAMPAAFAWAIREGVSLDFVEALFWVAPFEVVVIAWVFLGERPPLPAWGVAVFGAVTSAIIFGHLYAASLLGVALGLVGSLSFSAYVVMTRSLRTEPAPTNLLYTGLGVFLVLTPFIPHVWSGITLFDTGVMAIIGAVGVGALYALERACESGAAWLTATMLFVQVICVGMFDVTLGTAPSPHSGIGVAILVVALSAVWLFAGRLQPRSAHAGDE